MRAISSSVRCRLSRSSCAFFAPILSRHETSRSLVDSMPRSTETTPVERQHRRTVPRFQGSAKPPAFGVKFRISAVAGIERTSSRAALSHRRRHRVIVSIAPLQVLVSPFEFGPYGSAERSSGSSGWRQMWRGAGGSLFPARRRAATARRRFPEGISPRREDTMNAW